MNLLFYTGLCIYHKSHQEKFEHQECKTLAWPAVSDFRPFIKENLAFLGQKSYFDHNLAKMHQIDYLSALGCYIFCTGRVDRYLTWPYCRPFLFQTELAGRYQEVRL